MVKAINKQNFGGATKSPAGPAIAARQPRLRRLPSDIIYGDRCIFPEDVLKAAPPGSGTPTLDQIFDKFTQAIGGAAKIAALTSYHRQRHQPFVWRSE